MLKKNARRSSLLCPRPRALLPLSLYACATHIQIIKDAKDGVKDSAQLVIVSYDLATRMVDKSLLWKGQVRKNKVTRAKLTFRKGVRERTN